MEAARQVLIEALAKEPKNAFLKNYLGIFLAGQGEFEEAVPYLLGTFALNQNNTTKALAAAALELDDKEVMRALIPRLMNYRKGDTTMITILVFFGLKLEIAEPIYYRSVIEGCSKEYLLSNPDVRDLIHDYPQFFFDEDEIEPFFKKYNITDREEEE